ncbi:hypothetical protein [Puniceibacterium sediminis]|uniref:VPEID-CTERM protein sorting domain-containing protein n=1 Tax=Puniceibacterium sediminis TaxID=1608407 RepID=A0A238ZEM0_9RHOB|nr:hypothetical protein [Puniceibacterium sediminis]SNR81114.1 VPEID-CTERM protein sorting domain-containing protein [Puniceibacterium sediminis]
MTKLYVSAAAFVLSASSAMAGACYDIFGTQIACAATTAVPEISALEGTAGLAVLAAVVLLAWERRRRAV